jgi:hypothetical protein
VSAIIRGRSRRRCGDGKMHRGVIFVDVDTYLAEGEQEEDASKIDRSLVESIRCTHVPLHDPTQVLGSRRTPNVNFAEPP